MNYCVHNIIAILSVRNHSCFIRAGKVFFGLLFFLVFGLTADAQTATIAINTTSVCKGGTEPVITFTGSNGNPEYTFDYILDNGTTQSSLTTGTSIGNIIHLSVPTTVPGTYVYTLQRVNDANNNFTDLTGQSVTVIVNPLPAHSISASGPTTFRCAGGSVTLSTSAPPPGGSYTYQWVRVSDLGNDTTDIVNATNSSLLVTGGYRYAVRVTDNNGCVAVSDTIKVQQNPPPQPLNGAHNTTPVSACISYDPDILNFTSPNVPVSGGIGPYIYQWQSSTDGGASWNNISGGTSNSYHPPDLLVPGSYSYRANITDFCGETITTIAKTITINAAPTVIVTAPAHCSNNPASAITATPSPAGTYTYAWTVPAGVTNPGNVASFTSTITGLYEVTITDGNNCSATGSATLTVNAAPTVTVTAPTRCLNDPASAITATPSPAGTYTYIWTVPAGVTNPGNVASFTSTVAGSYEVTVIDGNNCSATSSATLTENAAPTLTVTTPTRCSNDPASIITATPLPAGTYTYIWTVPAGVTNPGNVASFTSTVAGSYGITITDGNNCPASSSAILTVNEAPTVAVNSQTVCAGTAATITATPGTAGTYSYLWTVPAGVPDPGNTASFTSAVAGTYNVVITSTATTCPSLPANGTVMVNPLPAVTVNSSTICAGAVATITATPVPAGTYNYEWTVPAGVPDPGNIASFTSAVAGTYSVVITDPATTCSASSSGTITVNPTSAPVITGPDPICVNSGTVTYNTPNVGCNTYSWTVSAGGTIIGSGTESTITVQWTTPGTKTVTVTETICGTGCSNTDSKNVLVTPKPVTTPITHN